MKLLLPVVFLCYGLLDADSARVQKRLDESEKMRQQRSDDVPALQTAFDQMVSRMSSLEARLAAAEAKNLAQDSEINDLKTRTCETGKVGFSPHDHLGRRHTTHIAFSHPFPSAPWVAVSLAELDADSDHNLRVDIGYSSVTNSGFDAFVYEWASTHLYGVQVTWIACSP